MVFFFQAEDGIRDLVRSRGLGDVYKRQNLTQTAEVRRVLPGLLAELGCRSMLDVPCGDFYLSLIHI